MIFANNGAVEHQTKQIDIECDDINAYTLSI